MSRPPPHRCPSDAAFGVGRFSGKAQDARSPSRRALPGWTLLETLIAVSLAALILALAYGSYHAATRILEGQHRRLRGRANAAHALAQLTRDLTCALEIGTEEASCLSIREETNGPLRFSTLTCCTAERPAGEDRPEWFEPRRLRIRVATGTGGARLLRESQPVVGPHAQVVETTVLAEAVSSFRVDALGDAEWVSAWPPEDGPQWPRAVRIRLACALGGVDEELCTEVWLPMAHVATSRVARASGAAP